MMDNRPVQLPQIEITAGTTAEHEAFLPSKHHLVKKMESVNGVRRLVQLASSAFEYFLLMDLAIMTPNLNLQKTIRQAFGFEIPSDTESICRVRLDYTVRDALILRDVAKRHVNILVQLLQPFVERPAHDAHEGCIAKSHTTMDRLRQFHRAAMITSMTGLTKRDQVIWRIATYLSALNMMHIENLVFRLAMATLTLMTIAKEHILSYIPETKLIAFLIFFARNIRIFDLLDIEARRLDCDV